MSLASFSVSLAVKDLAASLDFYEQLGFEHSGGATSQGWAMLGCGSATIGPFAGIEIGTTADPEGTGPAHIVLKNPDGNVIMFDQHVPRPKG